jgi:hypothetical protein
METRFMRGGMVGESESRVHFDVRCLMSVSGGETGTLGKIQKYNEINYINSKLFRFRFQFRFHFDQMNWMAGTPVGFERVLRRSDSAANHV